MKMFEQFARELEKYDPGVNRLYPPAPLGAIRRTEEKLGVRLPRDYVAFLRRWNGGLLFAMDFYDLLIWNVDDESLAGVAEYDMDIAKLNVLDRVRWGHPAHFLAIASYLDDNLVCLDMSRDGRPVIWLRDKRVIENEWATIEEWLEDEMDSGAEMYDYHGQDRKPPRADPSPPGEDAPP